MDTIINSISNLIAGNQLVILASLVALVIVLFWWIATASMIRASRSTTLTRFEKGLNYFLDTFFFVFISGCLCLLFVFVYHLAGNPSAPPLPHPPYPPDDWWRYGLTAPCVK